MNFNEAMQMLGTKLQGKYGHLGFKYKKSDKTLTRHSKNFTYMIAFSSFGGNTKDSIDHYGEAVPTRTYDEEHFTANIEVDPSGTFYGWVFKFMGGIQIIAPHECVEEMKRIAHRFL